MRISIALALPLALISHAHGQDIRELFAKLIRGYGFDCPSIKDAESYGRDHYGKIVKVWCGQGDRLGKPIYFRITEVGVPPSATYRIEPWRD